jgi:hypothetical protein
MTRAARGHATALVLAVTLMHGCASSYYDVYLAQHPGWTPDLPRHGMGAEEIVASLQAPLERHRTQTQLKRLRLFELGSTPWRNVPLASLEDGSFRPDPARMLVVIAEIQCFWSNRDLFAYRDAFSWYLVRQGGLVAWRHTAFDEGCEADPEIEGSVHSVPGFEETLRKLVVEPAP